MEKDVIFITNTIKRLSIILLLVCICGLNALSQCIDSKKIVYGGYYGLTNYNWLCPSYAFNYSGDTSKHWNFLNDPIDIKQAPAGTLPVKRKVEEAIRKFSGNEFYSNIKFNSVDIFYPKRLRLFKRAGRPDVSLKNYDHRTKYFFYYQYSPDTSASYLIGIAVTKDGKIISPFMFPPKKWYHPIDKSYTYCKLIDIARKIQPKIDPIESIKLMFDTKSQRFLWLITQELVNSHEGINYLNQVTIDAADMSQVQTIKTEESIVY